MPKKEYTLLEHIDMMLIDQGKLSEFSNETGISRPTVLKVRNATTGKFHQSTLDILYDYFRLEKDKRYFDNLRKTYKPTECLLGNLLRVRRLQMWLSLDDVALYVKGDKRSLARIEAGETLPSYESYYVTQLLKLYAFTPPEREAIRRFICILRDLVKIHNKYDIENLQNE